MDLNLESPVTAITTDRYGHQVAISTEDGKISFFDPTSMKLITSVLVKDAIPNSISFSDNKYGPQLAVGLSDGRVLVYTRNASNYTLTQTFNNQHGAISAVAFHPTQPIIASSCLDGTFATYKYNGSWIPAVHPANQLGLTAIAWGSDSADIGGPQTLFVGSVDGTIAVWYTSPGSDAWERSVATQAHDGWVLSIASPAASNTGAQKVASVGDDSKVSVSKYVGGQITTISARLSSPSSGVSWAMVDKTVVVAQNDGNTSYWKEDSNGNLVQSDN